MARHDEPNASHYSARYAAIKRQQERERDARPRQLEPCRYCGEPAALMMIRCEQCAAEFKRIAMAEGFDAAAEWERNGPYARKIRGEP